MSNVDPVLAYGPGPLALDVLRRGYIEASYHRVYERAPSKADFLWRFMHLILPYGFYSQADGSIVMFNRRYAAMWRIKPNGERELAHGWPDYVQTSWFFDDSRQPWRNKAMVATARKLFNKNGVIVDAVPLYEALIADVARTTHATETMSTDNEHVRVGISRIVRTPTVVRPRGLFQRPVRIDETTPRRRAWRNTGIAAINAGLEQRLFGLRPGENYGLTDPDNGARFPFTINGIPGEAYVRDIGSDELSIHAALWPAPGAPSLRCSPASFESGDVVAHAWVERHNGPWLQSGSTNLKARRHLLPTVTELVVEPHGYADRGRFYF
jgi:hypothetical protein